MERSIVYSTCISAILWDTLDVRTLYFRYKDMGSIDDHHHHGKPGTYLKNKLSGSAGHFVYRPDMDNHSLDTNSNMF